MSGLFPAAATRASVSMAPQILGRSRGQAETISASSQPACVLSCVSAGGADSVTPEGVVVSEFWLPSSSFFARSILPLQKGSGFSL